MATSHSLTVIIPTNFDEGLDPINKTWRELEKEGKSIGSALSFASASVGFAFENRAKNRYDNMPPYDENRVVLGQDGSYINASPITSTDGTTYICSQAPLPNTFNDHWAMVWQFGISTIMMLTDFEEGDWFSTQKADKYWPNELNEPVQYGSITVTLTGELSHEESITEYKLMISDGSVWTVETDATDVAVETDSAEQRTISIFHYTEWPDHGVPDEGTMTSLIEIAPDESMLVHCSAGIGRSGTYIACKEMCKLVNDGSQVEDIDPQAIIRALRDQRHGMVSSFEQYKFIHEFKSTLSRAERAEATS